MARAKQKVVTRVEQTDRAIRRAMVLDSVRGWTIPLVAILGVVLLWVLGAVGVIEMPRALEIAAAALLVLALHTGANDFIHERTSPATATTLLAFSALLAFVALGPLYEFLVPGAPLATVELHAGDAEAVLPLGGIAGAYRLVLDGHLTPSGGQVTRTIPYKLRVSADGGEPQSFEGEFSERWGRQRLGRRGSATVHVVRGSTQFQIDDSSGGDLHVALESLGEGGSSVTAQVYRLAFSTWLFVGLGVALTAAAALIDSWRETGATELMLTTTTLCVLFAVASIRRFASPHPEFGDFFFHGGVGAIVGLATGRLLASVKRLASS